MTDERIIAGLRCIGKLGFLTTVGVAIGVVLVVIIALLGGVIIG